MGRVFSSLSGFVGRWTNAVHRVLISFPIENMEVDDDSERDENINDRNDTQIHDCKDGTDFHLYENRNDAVLRSEYKPSTTMLCTYKTYNVQVYSASNVVTGDNNMIVVQQPDKLVQKLRIAKAEDGVANVVAGDAAEGAQVRSRTVVKNIAVYNPFIMTIGEGNVIYVLPECNFFADGASNFDPSIQVLQSMLPSPGVEPWIKKVFDIMCGVVDQLYPLRDGGKWQEFEVALNALHSKYNRNPGIKCFLLLEESVKLTYQNSFKAAKRMALESLNILNNEAIQINGALQDVLRVLGNVALASVYRRLPKRKLGKAFNCLEDARESSERLKRVNLTMPKFALALLDYEQARCHMEFGTLRCESKSCNKEAGKFLGLCIDRCSSLSDETKLYTAKQTFALIYMARLLLPSSHSEPGESKRVKKQCARQAEKHLEEYQQSHSHLGDYPVAARVKYLLTRSELCFLKRDYALAKDFGCLALEIALKYGFQLETAPAQNHVEQISRYCSGQHKLQRVKNLSSGHSSSTTTDSDQKYNITCSQRAT